MRRLMLCAMLIGCGGSEPTGPPEVPLIVGAWCPADRRSTATLSGGTWSVVLWGDKTVFRDVRRPSDGVIIRQEVRSCISKECHITGAPVSWTADNAIAHCQST